MSLDFEQIPTDTEKAMQCCMIKGEFTIYTDEKDCKFFWAVFKRLEGDQFLFKDLVDEVHTYRQINLTLLEKK